MDNREAMIASYSFAAGWDAALDEARGAVATVSVSKDTSYEMRMQALAVIETLREKPLASGGIYAGPPIPLGDGCVIPKSDAIDALREKP